MHEASKNMYQSVTQATHLNPRNFRMKRFKFICHIRCCFPDCGNIKCRGILQTQIIKKRLFCYTFQHSIETLYPRKHMQKTLHVSVDTVNHSGNISFLTL